MADRLRSAGEPRALWPVPPFSVLDVALGLPSFSVGMVALSLLLALSAPVFTTPVSQGEAPTRSEIARAIDGSLRWVRSRQDVESGSYGGLIETIGALNALTSSPRRYRPADGPFVAKALEFVLAAQRADGAFGSDSMASTSTRVMAEILERFDGYEEAAARSRGFLAGVPAEDGAGRPRVIDLARAAALLAARNDDGSWNGERAFVATTGHIVELNRLAHVMKASEAVDGAAGSTADGGARPLPAFSAGDRARAIQGLVRGSAFLLGEAVSPGKWGLQGQADPGITAMVTDALLANPGERSAEVSTAVELALDWLVSLQKEDGSIHAGQLANYVTSASIMALVHGGRPQDAPAIERARAFLQVLQADEGEGYTSSDRFYGGVGYGGDERPDLSNMQMALEALNTAGLEKGDETFRKALAFLERCQNRSESNTLEITDGGVATVSGNDGGAGYAPGDSKAGFIELRDGRRVPRSYGSMTYALLKGYLFAGLERDDARVQAAWEWLSKNYTLDVNPGFETSTDPTAAYQGLFYYLTTMAKALDLFGQETIVDGAGVEHGWRDELIGRLQSMQRQDGSWVNDNAPRWFEGNPVLATSYALISLGTALPDER